MTDYVKMLEGVRHDSQAKALLKRVKNLGNFQGYYSWDPKANICGKAYSFHYARL